jgi:transforming growth factor-beta-induced protein
MACSAEGFTVLCSAIIAAGLNETLSGGNFTVFAPTDDAFGNLLGPDADVEDLDPAVLNNLILYHAINGEIISSDNLRCDSLLSMANGEFAVT